jgi:hypothetical protein
MNTTLLFRRMAGVAALALTGFLSACGGGGKADLPSPSVQAAPTYTISGTLSGLSTGQSVSLLNASTSESLTVNANGNFAFLTAVPQNGSYGISVKTQPTGQVCSLAAGSGSGSGVVANVSNVQVTCSTDTYTIGGSISGLGSGQSVSLLNNGADALAVSANGTFNFATSVAYNGSYSVTVGTQPSGQTCSLAAGTGSGSGVVANISSVQITCSTNTYTVGGTLSGLGSGQQVTLLNNAGNALTLTANGTFTFTSPVAYNGSYAVTVGTQPTGQTCTASAASGSGVVANVGTVQITCSANTYTIGGTLSSLGSSLQVTLLNNGGNAKTLTANGSFTFSTPVAYGGSYSVTVSTQPTGQTCTLTNATGSGVAANVSNVGVSCATSTQYPLLAGRETCPATDPVAIDGTGAAASVPYNGAGEAYDAAGNLYVMTSYLTLVKITPAGVVTTIAGTYFNGGSPSAQDGTGSGASFGSVRGMAVDASGNIYLSDTNAIRKVTPVGVVTTFAGSITGPFTAGYTDGPGTTARFSSPQGLAIDATGNIFVADNNVIRKITPAGDASTYAGVAAGGGYVNGNLSTAQFNTPKSLVFDASGNLFVVDSLNNVIREITPAGVVSTFAGGGGAHTAGFADGTGTAALFAQPSRVTIDSSGNLFVEDQIRSAVRKITPTGVVTTPYVTPFFHSTYGLTVPVGTVVLTALGTTSSIGILANSAGQIAFPVGCAIETAGP